MNDYILFPVLFILGVILSIMLFSGYLNQKMESSQDPLILNNREWFCSISHEETKYLGKTYAINKVCDQYTRRGLQQ